MTLWAVVGVCLATILGLRVFLFLLSGPASDAVRALHLALHQEAQPAPKQEAATEDCIGFRQEQDPDEDE